jgi:glycosyltransferase involved in cell wall biosynthesis
MKTFPTVSIVIRTKNEAKWIWKTLKAIKSQSMIPEEIVVIDNLSQDSTITLAKELGASKILDIDDYSPGRALNLGMDQTTSEFVVFLSAHCVPCDEFWLEKLISPFHNYQIGATYGRQLPLPFSSDTDKSDLYTVFRNESQIQSIDGFINNANSAIRRSCWQQVKFDTSVTNVEDRVWGKEIISKGFKIAYAAESCVFHHNGMHKSSDRKDQFSTVSVLETKIFPDREIFLQEYSRVFHGSFLPIFIGTEEGSIKKTQALFTDSIVAIRSYFLDPVFLLMDDRKDRLDSHLQITSSEIKQNIVEIISNFARNQVKNLHPKVHYLCVIFDRGRSFDSAAMCAALNRVILGNNLFSYIGDDYDQTNLSGLSSGDNSPPGNYLIELDFLLNKV